MSAMVADLRFIPSMSPRNVSMSLRSSTNVFDTLSRSTAEQCDQPVLCPSGESILQTYSEEIVKSTGTGWKGREGGEDEVTYTGWKVGVSESEGDATERPQTGSLQTRQSRARNCYQLCGGGEEYGTVSGRASSLPPPPLS